MLGSFCLFIFFVDVEIEMLKKVFEKEVVFSPMYLNFSVLCHCFCNFDDHLLPKFSHRFVMLCIYWDTSSENTGL